MTSYKDIKEQLENANNWFKKAVEKLEKFEEGEDKQKRLARLEENLDDEEWKNEGQKKRWEDRVKKLEEEKERLEKNVDDWKKQVEEWGKALRGFSGGEGNEQIV